MSIIDISVGIYNGMPFYPGDPGAEIRPHHQIVKGDVANLSELHLGSHTGTHIDAPRHFIDEGAPVDKLPLDVLVGPARVIDMTRVKSSILKKDLEDAGIEGVERLLVKSTNSALWEAAGFQRDYVSFSAEAAGYLVESGVQLAGIDYLSIERFKSETHPVHHSLLEAGIIILEGVDLAGVEAGDYDLVCLPLKIVEGDGAPARAVLVTR